MMFFRKIGLRPRGFTLVEVLIVITLLMITLGMAVLYSEASQVRSDLNAQVAIFVSYARLQESEAAAGKNGNDFGIHLGSDAYVLFEGSVYNSSDTTNDAIELPPTVRIQNIALNGGGSDFIFTSPHGETSQFGTLDFYSTALDKSITITLSSLGTLHY